MGISEWRRGPFSLSFDVTDARPVGVTEGKRISIAAWLFFPDDPRKLGEPATYQAVMILGYTAQGVHFAMGGKKLRAADFLPQETPDYTTNDRAKLHEGFHWEDVPAEVIVADDAIAAETAASIGLDSIRTGPEHSAKRDFLRPASSAALPAAPRPVGTDISF
jgi:hypothetical protein